MTQQEVNNKPTTIVAFDSSYILVAIFKSISEAATLTNTIRQSLIKAAYGSIISVNKRYWRVVPPDFQIEPDDVGKLTLFEFDEAVGDDRKIYTTRKMLKNSVMLESEYLALQKSQGK
ncbi:hypothetical protein [Lepagella muris]|uniref:Uncharacterized protein n=1 Tax=Lepagella muris TaxID=3032870 RepID=A0AC61RGP5_9BACT|nr:hypothetical protein [Lepagella muris]TGY79031.1 hypothetical protein E5331_08180 [Lepagella muris]THG52472.1 hypothetical protein E5984_07455 [Bacteroidales bacterium]TKC54308.1 hypothetical protein E5359_019065 [Bacteroidales bacterium]